MKLIDGKYYRFPNGTQVQAARLPGIQLLLDRFFRQRGYVTRCYSNGISAQQGIMQEPPDLVFLDTQMETPDAGISVLEMMRSSPATHNIPVILCTGGVYFLQRYIHRLQNLQYEQLDKPFSLSDLAAKVEAVIGK